MQQERKQQLQNRLKRIEGQLRGVKRMVDGEAYCVDIITQTSAVRHALSSLEDSILRGHLETHVLEQMRGSQHKKAVDEILAIYQRAKKK